MDRSIDLPACRSIDLSSDRETDFKITERNILSCPTTLAIWLDDYTQIISYHSYIYPYGPCAQIYPKTSRKIAMRTPPHVPA